MAGAAVGVTTGVKLASGGVALAREAGGTLEKLLSQALTDEQVSVLDAARRSLDPCGDSSAQLGAQRPSLHSVLTASSEPTAEEWRAVRASCPELSRCSDAALNDALQSLRKINVDARTLFSNQEQGRKMGGL